MGDFEYRSLQQIVNSAKYPFTMGQLRHYLLMRHKNGLDKAVRHVGKRLYLREDLFEQWIEEQGGRGGKQLKHNIAVTKQLQSSQRFPPTTFT